MSWLSWLSSEPKDTQADPEDPHGYGPFICKTEQAIARDKEDKEAGS